MIHTAKIAYTTCPPDGSTAVGQLRDIIPANVAKSRTKSATKDKDLMCWVGGREKNDQAEYMCDGGASTQGSRTPNLERGK
jgi:hypothetical protein